MPKHAKQELPAPALAQHAALIAGFLQDIEVLRKLSPHTVASYRKDLYHWTRYLEGQGAELSKITLPLCRSYVAGMRQEAYSTASINRHISTLKSFYRYLHKHNLSESNPWQQIKVLSKQGKLPNFLSPKEVDQLAAACDQSLKGRLSLAIIEVAFSTGMRVAELCSLEVTQISKGGIIRRHLQITGKGNKTRFIFIGKRATEALQSYLPLRESFLAEKQETHLAALFVNSRGQALSPRSCYALLEDLGKKAGLQRSLHPHLLRHSFATELMNQGADIRSLQELLGHSSLNSTQLYTHTGIQHLKEVHRKAHPHGKNRGPSELLGYRRQAAEDRRD